MGLHTLDENLPQQLKIQENQLDLDGVIYEMRVAGTTFIDNSSELLSLLKSVPREKTSLSFAREPSNQYDPNAVKVYVHIEGFEKSRFIGYIPKGYSEMVSYVLSHKDTYKLFSTRPSFCGGVEGKENIGVFFNLKIQRGNYS